jgi:hypothetical protein
MRVILCGEAIWHDARRLENLRIKKVKLLLLCSSYWDADTKVRISDSYGFIATCVLPLTLLLEKKSPFKEPLFSHSVLPDFPPNLMHLLRSHYFSWSFCTWKRELLREKFLDNVVLTPIGSVTARAPSYVYLYPYHISTFGFLFYPEYGNSKFLRNDGNDVPRYIDLRSRIRCWSSELESFFFSNTKKKFGNLEILPSDVGVRGEK